MPSRLVRLSSLLALLLSACGGQAGSDARQPGAGGSGGSVTTAPEGGKAQGGGAAAGSGGAAAGSGGSSGGLQCSAQPACGSDEVPLKSGSACPDGNVCRELTLCGTTIVCSMGPRCGAVPQCDGGDTRLDGACPPSASCYTRTLCGSTVTCLEPELGDGGAGGAGGVPECAPGFVPCDQAPGFCFQTVPDTDNDGCCGCLMP